MQNERSPDELRQIEQLKQVVIQALEDLKADNIVILDVSARTSITDYMIIASGTSSRHVKSIADNVVEEARKKGERPLGVESGATNDWVLVDLGEIVVHVMLPATRTFYDLERFWRDGPDQVDSAMESEERILPARLRRQ